MPLTTTTRTPPRSIVPNTARTGRDSLSIALHWGIALLVILQFILAEFWGFAPQPAHHLMIASHMSLGIVLTMILIARTAWHWAPGRRRHASTTGLVELAAKTMHSALFLLLLAQAAIGFAVRWTDNEALTFFGLPIPSPFGPFSKATGQLTDQVHNVTAWLIIILAALHAGAALFHHFILRDDVLRHMLPGAPRETSG